MNGKSPLKKSIEMAQLPTQFIIILTTLATSDYLKNEGLEVLAEIARFWADRVHFSKRAQ